MWYAAITSKGRSIHLGCFKNFEDAVTARKAGEEKYFGQYSYDASMAYAAQYALPEGDKPIISDPEENTSFLTPMAPKKKPSNHVKILPKFRVPQTNQEDTYEDLFKQNPVPPLWGDYREQACP